MDSDDLPRPGSPAGRWSVPQCPFVIEYDPAALDDIRLAVMDAFFSLPRGGVEIGGVLWGTRNAAGIYIRSYESMECEHASGPSFRLSEKDHARIAAALAAPHTLEPLGWFHSHTRSELFLSEEDVAVHRRHFPQPWQVALVLRPSTFQPTRAGFFFVEAGGKIHTEASYEEFEIQPLTVRPAPSGPPPMHGVPPEPAGHAARARRESAPEAAPPAASLDQVPPEISTAPAMPAAEPPAAVEPLAEETLSASREAVETEPPPAPEPPAQPIEIKLPYSEPPAPKRRLGTLVACLAVVLLVAAGGYLAHSRWVRNGPVVKTAPPPATPLSAGLSLAESGGQVQIRWDRASKAVREANDGFLEISEATGKTALQLDAARIRAGSFTYARQTERVDVKLRLKQPDGTEVQDLATFMGKLPRSEPATEESDVRAERDALAREAAQLKEDLGKQNARTRKLEESLDRVRRELERERRRRLGNQSQAPGK